MFLNRIDAAKQLVEHLDKYKGVDNAVVIGVPRGGIVLSRIIADELELPMDMIMVKKIGHPINSEFAIGAVSITHQLIDKAIPVNQTYINSATARIRDLLMKRYKNYYGEKPMPDFKDKTVIVVDDGVATGYTLIAALRMIREEEPSKLIVAIPVGPTSVYQQLEEYADEVICLETHENFGAISMYYEEFDQVPDDKVKELIK